MKILVINGANLNMLGIREPEKYGGKTLKQIEQTMISLGKDLGASVDTFQSNIEGEIVDAIQKSKYEWDCNGIVINPAAYTHTSIAIRDAISAICLPTVEVHISNINSREEFRKHSFIAPVCIGQISGFGLNSYKLGIEGLLSSINS